jgi:hypothetical protein
MAICLSGTIVVVCSLFYMFFALQQHRSPVKSHGVHRNSSSPISQRTPGEDEGVLAKFPKGMPDSCRLQHMARGLAADGKQAPRLLHMASNPGPSTAFTVAHFHDGSVSLKTSRGFYLVVDGQTRSIILQRSNRSLTHERKDSSLGDHFKVFYQDKCQVALKTSSGYFISALGDGMLDTSSEVAGVRESFDAYLNPDGTVALRMWDGSYLDAEQMVDREQRFAVTTSENSSSKTFIRIVEHRNREVSLVSWYGTYLSAAPNGIITANSTSIGLAERFTIEHVSGDSPQIALKTSFGKYVQIRNGSIVATSEKVSTCAKFVISERSSDYASLKSCHRHISVERVPIYSFFGYRAVSSEDDFGFTNVNVGNLAGVMWYLHNEVIVEQPRKFGITRIVRAKFRVTAPDELLPVGMHFGVRFAYDSGMCNGAGNEEWQGNGSCDPFYRKYGFFVGCNNLNNYPFPMASQGYPNHYPGARWYSLPGESCCGEGDIVPTGEPECLYSYELAGEINISEMVGIEDYDTFVSQGGKEYVYGKDAGEWCSFWDKKFDTDACEDRLQAARRTFAKNFRGLYSKDFKELDDQEPPCDFDCYRFYDGDPYDPPDLCNETLQTEIAAQTHPMSAPSWTWDYGMNVSEV